MNDTFPDVVYTEGFPEGWRMVHRPDATLLVCPDWPLGARCLCVAPRLMQGERWLDDARKIAIACHGVAQDERRRREAEFCDHCGVGPPTDHNGEDVETIRDLRDWICDHCGALNRRPLPPPPEGEG